MGPRPRSGGFFYFSTVSPAFPFTFPFLFPRPLLAGRLCHFLPRIFVLLTRHHSSVIVACIQKYQIEHGELRVKKKKDTVSFWEKKKKKRWKCAAAAGTSKLSGTRRQPSCNDSVPSIWNISVKAQVLEEAKRKHRYQLRNTLPKCLVYCR